MIKILPMALLTPFVFGTAADTEAPVPENLAPELEEGEGLVPPHLSSRRRFELADCADLDQQCPNWARQGYCSTNTYVKTYCKASCGSCFINTTGTQTSNKEVDIQEAKRENSLLGERWGTGLNADQGWQPQALAGQPAAGQPAAGQPAAGQWNPFRGQRLTDIDRITNTNELLDTQKTTQFGNVEGNPELFNNGLGGNNPDLFNNGHPTVGDEYKGCYESWQINDNRVYKNSVAITAQGLADCRNGCVGLGYDMYGFECPRAANNQVHCECIYGTPRADLLRPDCHVNVGACNARHSFNGFNLGTAHRMTVYKVQNAVAGNRG